LAMGCFSWVCFRRGKPACVDRRSVHGDEQCQLHICRGTLTTLHGATIDNGTNTAFNVGTLTAIGPGCWNINGGTNTITYKASGSTQLGYLSGSWGGVTVSGANTLLSVGGGTLTVGYNGTGSLTITNGAHVISPESSSRRTPRPPRTMASLLQRLDRAGTST